MATLLSSDETVNKDGTLLCLVSLHVDDAIISINERHAEASDLLVAIKGLFDWGTWEFDSFVHLNQQVTQQEDFSISVSQEQSLLKVREIEFNADRRAHPKLGITPEESTICRSILGELLHFASNTCPWLSASVSFLCSLT